VMKSTKANISKQRSCFQDFPFLDDVSDFPTAVDIAKHIEEYANHFELKSHCRMGVPIHQVKAFEDRWMLEYSQKASDVEAKQSEVFDKVVVTTGAYHKAHMLTYEGMDKYRGKVLHVQGYKE